MGLTLSQLAAYSEDALRAFVDQGLSLFRSSRKGSKKFGNLLTKDLLTFNILEATRRYVPVGTVITPGASGEAVFDLSPYASATTPNCNDVRVVITRLDSPVVNICDKRIDKQGFTDEQWAAAIATAVTSGGSGYTATTNGMELNISAPSGSTDTGDIQLDIYAYADPNNTIYYPYYDWTVIDPAFTIIPTGLTEGDTSGTIYIAYSLNTGGGLLLCMDDGQGLGFASQIVTGATGISSRPQKFPSQVITLFYSNPVTGFVEYITSAGGTGTYGSAITPASNNCDSIYSATTGFIYFINGANYQKINAAHTVTNSTSPSIPDDEYLTLNVLTGVPFSYRTNNATLTNYADSGALTTNVLTVNVAGRIATYNNQYYVPQHAARRIYIYDSAFAFVSFIDLTTFTGMSVTANVLHAYIFSDYMYIIHTDGNVSVYDLTTNGLLDTFFAGVGVILFSETASLGVMYLNDTGVWRVSVTNSVVTTQPMQGGSAEVVWTEADNCLTEAEQKKLMGKVQREWIDSCGTTVPTGGSSPIGSATFILTSTGEYLLTSTGEYVTE